MKAILILFALLLLVIPAAAEPLTLTPDRIDSYIIYIGFGEPQRAEYTFVANRDLASCEIPNSTCTIDGHVVTVGLVVNENSESFESTLKVKDALGSVATSHMIIRIKDIGASFDIAPVNVSSCESGRLLFRCEDSEITGIRLWFVTFIGVMFVIAFAQAFVRD